jgi:4-diphosphocytidyl-2-C-methyl-D-erythritol kinase
MVRSRGERVRERFGRGATGLAVLSRPMSPSLQYAFPAPAKLNLFLHVIGRRADGYHLLQSIFRLVDLCDTVHIEPREDGRIVRVTDIAGVPEDVDLTLRAARALQAATGCAKGASIAVEKRIPMGAGMGGGSSDAATVLLALNALWKTGLDTRQLADIGLKLGADVPFFVYGRNAFVEGVGEQVTPITVPPEIYLVLKPPVGVATASVFAHPELTRNAKSVKIEDFSGNFSGGLHLGTAQGAGPKLDGSADRPETASEIAWKAALGLTTNHLQAVVEKTEPTVVAARLWLAQALQKTQRVVAGGVQVSVSIPPRMTGSGACVFAGFAADVGVNVVQEIKNAVPPELGAAFVVAGLSQHPILSLLESL